VVRGHRRRISLVLGDDYEVGNDDCMLVQVRMNGMAGLAYEYEI
jgi:hypothetical protein